MEVQQGVLQENGTTRSTPMSHLLRSLQKGNYRIECAFGIILKILL